VILDVGNRSMDASTHCQADVILLIEICSLKIIDITGRRIII